MSLFFHNLEGYIVSKYEKDSLHDNVRLVIQNIPTNQKLIKEHNHNHEIVDKNNIYSYEKIPKSDSELEQSCSKHL